MFKFMHGYLPGVWEAQERVGMIGENDGIRFCQSIMIKDEMKFNVLASKDSELYKILSKRKCAFYIDRLQGGCYIDEYPYDKELLNEYKGMLGDNFWGFQMHEWLQNYRYDVFCKLAELSEDNWTEEAIIATIRKNFPYPYLMLESMTAKEMAEHGKPKNAEEFFGNMVDIYKKRLEIGELIPCDSGFMAYNFEVANGTKRIMAEVGAQTADARLQICYARGMTRKDGRSFGVYYEPWGGEPFSACCYQKDNKNEWGIGESKDFPFETKGPNGGSSLSLQKRIFLYALLNNVEFISEEWGLCNVFYDWNDFELSPYGKVKKEFLDFARKYDDIGDKIAPIAVVIPKDLMVLDNWYESDVYCGFFNSTTEKWDRAKRGIVDVFTKSLPMIGNEIKTLKNSDIPDIIDMFNDGQGVYDKYEYVINLTGEEVLDGNHCSICKVEDISNLAKEILPCYVEGNAHWVINHRKGGGYYLSVFNHSGVERTVAKGEVLLKDAETTVKVDFKGKEAKVLEGEGVLSCSKDGYVLTIPAGGWAFILIETKS